MKYLITASELKWGDYKNLDSCQKMNEKLQDYKITCDDILVQKEKVIEEILGNLTESEEDFNIALVKQQKGKVV